MRWQMSYRRGTWGSSCRPTSSSQAMSTPSPKKQPLFWPEWSALLLTRTQSYFQRSSALTSDRIDSWVGRPGMERPETGRRQADWGSPEKGAEVHQLIDWQTVWGKTWSVRHDLARGPGKENRHDGNMPTYRLVNGSVLQGTFQHVRNRHDRTTRSVDRDLLVPDKRKKELLSKWICTKLELVAAQSSTCLQCANFEKEVWRICKIEWNFTILKVLYPRALTRAPVVHSINVFTLINTKKGPSDSETAATMTSTRLNYHSSHHLSTQDKIVGKKPTNISNQKRNFSSIIIRNLLIFQFRFSSAQSRPYSELYKTPWNIEYFFLFGYFFRPPNRIDY